MPQVTTADGYTYSMLNGSVIVTEGNADPSIVYSHMTEEMVYFYEKYGNEDTGAVLRQLSALAVRRYGPVNGAAAIQWLMRYVTGLKMWTPGNYKVAG